jgi:hypothetical protein
MSIITKFKHPIATWLRAIIADELAKLDVSLQVERAAFACQVRSFEARFDAALDRLIAQSNPHAENRELRATIKEMSGHITEINAIAKKL